MKSIKKTIPLSAKKSPALKGAIRIPGDKSISHRALMFGALTVGETIIGGLLEGEDVISTANALRAMGASIERGGDGIWRVHGTGIGGLREPGGVLDMGNSGTSTRLLMGIIAGHDISATITGDASLVKRPMGRVIAPLEKMGARFLSRSDSRLPLTMRGAQDPLAIEYTLPVASAQVKSAILLAGLNARGTTTVIEPHPTRDHTENMLKHFGAVVKTENLPGGGQAIAVNGYPDFKPCAIDVPGDPSSAAFPVVAALVNPGSEIETSRILTGERRNGLYLTLREMGAEITFTHERMENGERVAGLLVKGTNTLRGIDVPPERVPSMIDEFPALAIAATCANGTTRMTGLSELRVKESDRLLMIARGLEACGVRLEMGEDWLTIHGTGKPPRGGALIETAMDHRIAMSFLVLGTVTDEPVTIDDSAAIATSFPNFVKLMGEIGANIMTSDTNNSRQ